MTPIDRFERRLPDGLNALADPRVPSYLDDILADTARARQRPAWSFLERWLPMAVIARRPATAPPLRAAWVLILAALLGLALVAGGAIVGARLLAVNATAPIPVGGAAVLAYDSHDDIFAVRADGTDVRQLTSGPDVEQAPSWSPDGTRIAFRFNQAGSESVAVLDVASGSITKMALADHTGLSCVPYEHAAWSPDSTMLVFAIGCVDRNDLFIGAADGSSPAVKLLAPGMNSTAAAWSPDATQIAFRGREANGDTGLYVVDLGTGSALEGGFQARRITEAGTDLDWTGPQWSPDGTQVAAASGTNEDCIAYNVGTMDVVIAEADGSGQRALVSETAKEYNPTWSPDGKRLAYQTLVEPSEWVAERPCTAAVMVIDANGLNSHRLEAGLGPDPGSSFWSPDGTRVIGAGPTGDPVELGLYVITVDNTSPLVEIDVNGDFYSGTWQPVVAPLPPL